MSATGEWLQGLPEWASATLVALFLVAGSLLVGLTFERIVLATIRRLAGRTRSELDDLVVRAVHPAVAILVVVLTMHAGLWWLGGYLPSGILRAWQGVSLAIGILLAAIVAARLLGGVIRHSTRSKERWQPLGRVGMRVGNVLVYVTAFLVILGSYGIAITPLITSLGIAGLAVALALQDTLANFFAGVWIQTGKSLQPGHYVKLEGDNLEGYIEEVGWRTTKIRQLSNNITVVPNAKFAQATVTDFHLPVPRMSLLVPVSVGYECDPDHIERVLVEVATKAARDVPGLLADPAPFVRFIPGFGDSALQFTLICQVREFVDQYLAQHELRKRILARFRQEGIRIPYPIREIVSAPVSRPDVATA